MLNDLLISRKFTKSRELIVDAKLGTEFYLSHRHLGLSKTEDKYIKLKIVDESFGGTEDEPIWYLDLKSLDARVEKNFKITIDTIEEFGVPVVDFEKKYYQPVAGDFIGVLVPYNKDEKWELVEVSGKEVTSKNTYINPRFKNGEFVKKIDENFSVVKFKTSPSIAGGYSFSLRVPNKNITNLSTMNALILNKRLEHFYRLQFDFQKDEMVRFRHNGRIYYGKIVEQEDGKFKIRNSKNKKKYIVSKENIFKEISGKETYFTSTEGNKASELFFDPRHSERTIDALNGVARLTSLKEFNELTDKDQVKIITAYVMTLVQYDMKVGNDFHFGEPLFDEAIDSGDQLLRSGVNFDYCVVSGSGVCRHLAPLVAMALRESGFKDVKLGLSNPLKLTEPGHVWTEVMIDNKWYIAEPSYLGRDLIRFLRGNKIDETELSFFMSLDAIRKRKSVDDMKHYLNVNNDYIRM